MTDSILNRQKEEEKTERPCSIFLEKEGQFYEAIQTVSYDYNQTANTVYVERKVITSEAQPTSRVDVLKWFCK